MKKLFLYLSIVVCGILIFLIGFNVSRKHFSESSKNYTKYTEVEMEETSTTVVPTEETTEVTDTSVKDVNSDSVSLFSEDKFFLGIKNDYVVIYKNNLETVYEYTDITLNMLQEVDENTYNVIENNVIFDSLEKVFSFLESIDS